MPTQDTASLHIFKAGTLTANDGVTYTITAGDVADCAACYDPKLHEAPLVLGHPKTEDPAYGWAVSLQSNGGDLSASFSEVDDVAKGLVRSGKYKKISSSFYPPKHPSNPVPGKWYLRHVGLLGAVPPADKGLPNANFSDEQGCVEFSEDVEYSSTKLFRRIRDWMIAKFGQDEADQVIPNWEVEHMSEIIAGERMRKSLANGNGMPDFSEAQPNPQPNPPTKSPSQESIEMTEQEKAAIQRAEAAEAELAQLKASQAKTERDASHQSNADFAENLVKGGKLQPAHKGMVAQVLDFMTHPNDTTADFGEGDSKKPLAAAFRDFLSNARVSPLAGELARGSAAGVGTHQHADFSEADADALAHHNRAAALAKSEGISYEDAARRTA